jgi:putative colanic acid biosynthesis acetyltransferase WcaF
MRLDNYTTGNYTPGASLLVQLLWYYIGDLIVRNRILPSSAFKVLVLRSFGAKMGQGIRIKPGLRVKFPWRLDIGNYCWLGENAWLDNLAPITLGDHVCLSQEVYLCTGNHDWNDPDFALQVAPIAIESGSWIAARAVVGPGVHIGQGAVLGLGSVASRSLEPMTIYAGNPAQPIKQRKITPNVDITSD